MPIAEKYRPFYTYDEYCQWEGRWELIEGLPYAMSPLPVPEHQRVSLNFSMIFNEALKKCKDCKVYPPLDWKISDDTVLQPDVLIVCKKIEKKYLDFPPVLLVEVLSPSTAAKDRNVKMKLYQLQQVKYYLIVDPQFKKIEIYQIQDKRYQPVSINPDYFEFMFDNCQANVKFINIWE
jgi:Uma2 family endonuclease